MTGINAIARSPPRTWEHSGPCCRAAGRTWGTPGTNAPKEAATSTQLLGRWARDASLRRSSRPRQLWLAGGTASGVWHHRPSMRDEFLKAALPPSCLRTGRPRPRRTSAACRSAQVKPVTLTGQRGARRSFWDVGPQGLTVGAPRQKVGWPIPVMCLVPSTGSMATATTEPRGVAARELRSSLEATCSKPQW